MSTLDERDAALRQALERAHALADQLHELLDGEITEKARALNAAGDPAVSDALGVSLFEEHNGHGLAMLPVTVARLFLFDNGFSPLSTANAGLYAASQELADATEHRRAELDAACRDE